MVKEEEVEGCEEEEDGEAEEEDEGVDYGPALLGGGGDGHEGGDAGACEGGVG